MQIILQPAFILHHRPYRETSLLLEVFTQDFGRISLIARGVCKNRSRLKSHLQLFNPLLVSCRGKGELMNLSGLEPNGPPIQLKKNCLLSGFYINELLMRVLPKQDSHAKLYTIYQDTLLKLQGEILQQEHLRIFEKNLLEELGYGLALDYDFSNEEQIQENNYYLYDPERGFKQTENHHPICFRGKSLLALASEKLHDAEALRDAKRLMRLAFSALLDFQSLHSRKLFKNV